MLVFGVVTDEFGVLGYQRGRLSYETDCFHANIGEIPVAREFGKALHEFLEWIENFQEAMRENIR